MNIIQKFSRWWKAFGDSRQSAVAYGRAVAEGARMTAAHNRAQDDIGQLLITQYQLREALKKIAGMPIYVYGAELTARTSQKIARDALEEARL